MYQKAFVQLVKLSRRAPALLQICGHSSVLAQLKRLTLATSPQIEMRCSSPSSTDCARQSRGLLE